MERIKKVITEYSQIGHPQFPEDTWKWERETNNVDELFKFMKDIHKRDAYSFTDFPLNGSCDTNGFRFVIEETVILGGKTFIGEREEVKHPTYFKEAVDMYEKFYKRLKTTLPILREAKNNRRKKEEELELLKNLKSKYE